jgi:hypothetical protein
VIRLLALCLILAVPAPAMAQQFMISGAKEKDPVDYEVRPGDTLWDLCDDFYSDPYFWPRVWARNPQLTNPHWIYPGDVLRFYPRAEFDKEDAVRKAKEVAEDGGEAEDGAQAGPVPSPGGARVRFVPREWEQQYFVRMVGFLTDAELEESGHIRNSKEERVHLGELDEVYVEFKRLPRVRPGDRWSILAVREQVVHPVFGNPVGSRIDILGVLEVTAVDRYVARGIIVRSYKAIERGAIVSPLIPNFRSVKPRPNQKDIDGYVIDTHSDRDTLATHDIVFIDRGTRDKVEVGNRFVVFRRGDGYFELPEGEESQLPWEPTAEIMVIETKDRYSTGLVINVVKEVAVGDFIRMRRFF